MKSRVDHVNRFQKSVRIFGHNRDSPLATVQKISTSHALLLPPVSQYAKCRPSGDGIAHPNPQPSHPLDQPFLPLGVSRNGLTTPFRSTLTSLHVFSVV